MQKRIVITLSLLGGGLILMVGFFQSRPGTTLISPAETFARLQSDTTVVLLDVRTEGEHYGESGRIAQSVLIPVQELAQRVDELEPYRDKTIIAYCRSGNRSGRAAEFLASKGYRVLNMEGGMIRWNQEQLPVERGEP